MHRIKNGGSAVVLPLFCRSLEFRDTCGRHKEIAERIASRAPFRWERADAGVCIMDLVNLAHGSARHDGAASRRDLRGVDGQFRGRHRVGSAPCSCSGMALVFLWRSGHLYGRDHLDQVLVMFRADLVLQRRGAADPAGLALLPAWLTVPVQIMPGVFHPADRLLIIAVVLAVAALLDVVVMRTAWARGSVRGVIGEMIGALGISIIAVFHAGVRPRCRAGWSRRADPGADPHGADDRAWAEETS